MHNSNSIDEDAIDAGITRAYGILPDQGPIGVFIHHNTLHSYQHLPFHRAIQEGAARLGAHAYMALERFHAAWKSGRIEESLREHQALLDALLARDVSASVTRMQAHFANGLEAAS